MHAVIRTGGKQYRVKPGDEFNIEKIADAEKGGTITFDEVLAVGEGDDITIGAPLVEGASVVASVVVGEGRARKVIIFKKRRRKGYRVKRGHRQPFTRIKIKEVNAG
ncbi:50S ribosomal protein L21 [Lujinxingia vulgaris]|uniref:Large ribosomal subunit protein bL21 n=1 Tax=Lujinxingia vulgaris TaxID=2600176 RepID=A0A5C6XJ21_9DELT|nr:50S ribosomal protein L21 [Lujinxingia vulgaris]TXD37252.1 50S ribosomal protein L21 [Lujinxingia vulgaris]